MKMKGGPLVFLRRHLSASRRSIDSQMHHGVVLVQGNTWIRGVTWSLILTAGFGLAWLAIARTEEVIVVQGKLEPEGDVKEIQLPVGGVVKKILVKTGDRVEKGQVLIQLDQEVSTEQLRSLSTRIRQKEAQIVQTQQLTDQQIKTTNEQLELDRKILGKLESLQSLGATSEFQYLQQKTAVQKLVGDLSKIALDGRRQVLILEQELAQLKAELAQASVSLRYQSLRSPVAGTIFDLKPTTIGFVAQTSQPVLKIVPLNRLEADVEVPSDKIGFVRVGMQADISIDSFPASDFGVLNGVVDSIGSDAFPPDQQKQRIGYAFPVTIGLKEQSLKLASGQFLPLQVGMSLTANIKLRSVSYLQLLLNTFRSKADSLREL